MKIVKTILVSLGTLVAIFLIMGLFISKEYHVERSIAIKADRTLLVDQIRNLKQMQEWSPWKDYDPDVKITYSGKDGEVGSSSTWEGNDKVGKGSQEILEFAENHVDIKVNFKEPWESECKSHFHLDLDPAGVVVTWGFDGKNSYPWNVFSKFYDMDKMLGADFEKGLARLKERAEKMEIDAHTLPNTYRGYEVNEVDFGQKIYITKKAKVKFEEIGAFYQKNFPIIFNAAKKAGLKPNGQPSGLFFKWDDSTKTTDMAAALPVVGDEKTNVKGYETIPVKGKALHIAYMGAYEKSGQAHEAMDDCMRELYLIQGNVVVEEYVTDPTTEPDTSKWLTNIYYLLKEAKKKK